MRVKTLPIFLAFFLMGLADAMGPMSDGVKKQYELSNLVAYGEAISGFLPYANDLLEKAGSPKRYKNLLGITLESGLRPGGSGEPPHMTINNNAALRGTQLSRK